MDIVTINNHDVGIREYDGQRVVTFEMIEKLHKKQAGAARKRFSENKEYFIEGKHYYMLQEKEAQTFLKTFVCDESSQAKNINKVRSLVVFTLKGYLHLVKSFSDELSWQIHDELIDGYFVNKMQPTSNALLTSELKQILGAFGDKAQSLEDGAYLHKKSIWKMKTRKIS